MREPAILYGTTASPFVRRVAVWLGLQGIDYVLEEIKVFGDGFEAMRQFNPLSRIPALVLDGEAPLIETWAIIDELEARAATDLKLIPVSGAQRREVMQQIALASSVAEKTVALAYEKTRRPPEWQWPEWGARLERQVRNGLEALEGIAPESGWLGGTAPNGADVAVVCAYDYAMLRAPGLAAGRAGLAAHSERTNRLASFADTKPQP